MVVRPGGRKWKEKLNSGKFDGVLLCSLTTRINVEVECGRLSTFIILLLSFGLSIMRKLSSIPLELLSV